MNNIIRIAIKVKDTASKSFKRINNITRAYDKTLHDLNGTTDRFNASMRNMVAAIGGMGLAKEFIQINSSAEKLKIMLNNLMPSAKEATKAFEYIRNSANQLPFSLNTLQSAFIKLQVSGLKPMAGSLTTVADAVAAFGGTSQDLELATVAIQQMSSKGVISMEELRQQLGERIPTAMRDMAQGLGVTMNELNNIIASGKLTAEEGLNAMFKVWEEKYDGMSEKMMSGFSGIAARLKTSFQNIALAIGDAGLFDTIKQKISEVTQKIQEMIASGDLKSWAESISSSISGLINYFAGLGKFIGGLISYIRPLIPLLAILTGSFITLKGAMMMLKLPGAFFREVAALAEGFKTLFSAGKKITTLNLSETFTSFSANIKGAITSVRAFINSLGALGTAFVAVGAAWGAWKIAELLYAMEQAYVWSNKLKEAQQELGSVQEGLTGRLQSINDALGTNFKNMKEFHQAVKDGVIAYNEAAGAWELVKGKLEDVKDTTDETAKAQENLGNATQAAAQKSKQAIEQTAAAMQKSMREIQDSVKTLQNGTDGTDLTINVSAQGFEETQAKIDALREKAGDDVMLNLKLDIWQQRLNEARELYERGVYQPVEENPVNIDANTEPAKESFDDLTNYIDEEGDKVIGDTKKKIDKLKQQMKDAFAEIGGSKSRKETVNKLGGIVKQAHNANTLQEINKVTADVRSLSRQLGGDWSGLMRYLAVKWSKAMSEQYKAAKEQKEVYQSQLALWKKRNGYSTGGFISGYGGGDKIPALLEKGEYVIRKEAVRRYGLGIIARLNRLQLPKFANGGLVGAADSGMNITFNLNGQSITGRFENNGLDAFVNELKRSKSVSIK